MTSSLDPHLRDALAEQTGHLSMSTPLDDILARSDRQRRARRRGLAGGGAALGALATVGAVALPMGSTPLVTAASAWGPSMVNIAPEVLDEAARQCPEIPVGADPVAADSRNGETVTVYHPGRTMVVCTFRGTTAADLQVQGSSSGRWKALAQGTDLEIAMVSLAQETLETPYQDGAGAARVSDEVASVTLDVAGEELDAAVGDGLAMFWTPDGMTEDELEAATLTAYDADGAVLSTVPLD